MWVDADISIARQLTIREDPRWWLGNRHRQPELCESGTLLRCWSHAWWRWRTWQGLNIGTLNHSPWKSSPHHDTLWERAGCHPYTAVTASCGIQTCLGDFWQTKQMSTKCHMVSLSQNQHNLPGQTDPPAKNKKQKNLNNKQWNWKLVHSGWGEGSWEYTGEGGRGNELNSWESS
jgi:hypothetical protein